MAESWQRGRSEGARWKDASTEEVAWPRRATSRPSMVGRTRTHAGGEAAGCSPRRAFMLGAAPQPRSIQSPHDDIARGSLDCARPDAQPLGQQRAVQPLRRVHVQLARDALEPLAATLASGAGLHDGPTGDANLLSEHGRDLALAQSAVYAATHAPSVGDPLRSSAVPARHNLTSTWHQISGTLPRAATRGAPRADRKSRRRACAPTLPSRPRSTSTCCPPHDHHAGALELLVGLPARKRMESGWLCPASQALPLLSRGKRLHRRVVHEGHDRGAGWTESETAARLSSAGPP